MATDHQHAHSETHRVPTRKSCCGAVTCGPPMTDGSATAKDPVCGMTVEPGSAKGGSAEHGGQTYYFCNPRCREKFVADPGKYFAPAAPLGHADHADHEAHHASQSANAPETSQVGKAATAGTTYVCPM